VYFRVFIILNLTAELWKKLKNLLVQRLLHQQFSQYHISLVLGGIAGRGLRRNGKCKRGDALNCQSPILFKQIKL